jgi:hypothetical protein
MSNSFTEWAWPWWTVMVIINAVNLVICAIIFKRSLNSKNGDDSTYRKRMCIMGTIFTVVGAYRAVFVSRYFAQLAWFDLILNSSLLIRMFAVAAELSFSGLFAMAMLRFNSYFPAQNNKESGKFKSFMTTKSPYILVLCIFVAQFFATSGLIIKSNTLFAIEETLWFVGFLAVLPLALYQLRHIFSIKDKEDRERFRMLRIATLIIAAWCVFYCCYGLFYHLPLETWASAIEQLTTGDPPLKTDPSAIADAFFIVNESKKFSDWGFGFLLWHSAYFSICVWISLFLMQAPRPRQISQQIDGRSIS